MASDLDSSLDTVNSLGCGCAACEGGGPAPLMFTNEDFEDPLYAPSGEATPEQFANYLTSGFWSDTGRSARSWANDTITYSLSNEFSANQQAGLTMAFDLWADVADISFSLVSSGADIAVYEGDDGRAYSSSSTSGGTIISNSISIDTNTNDNGYYFWSNFNDLGDYALMTAIHEIGHSLGLGHTGNYNGSASYDSDAQWTNDSHQYTVMSYFNDQNVGSDHFGSDYNWYYSASPMLYDILAIQNIYGADYTTRSGNTTYGFNSTAGRDQYDFSVSEAPVAIWDGGGTDTLDLSGYSTNQTIYLTEGDYSSVGSMTNNLVIAYGATIENAIGGTGNDDIYGNDADNILTGGLGHDDFYGSAGSDTLEGDGGTDTVTYDFNISDFLVYLVDSVTLQVQNIASSWVDTLENIESFIFNSGTLSFAEMAELDASEPADISLNFKWTGGSYDYTSNVNGDQNISAETMGFDGASGSVISMSRSPVSGLSISTFSADAPERVTLFTADEGDTITVTDIYNQMTVYFTGGGGEDVINVNSGKNGHLLLGGGGDDTITGGSGEDRIEGGADNDTLSGGSGIDRLFGDDGDDNIYGGDGNDRLYGGSGLDTIYGHGDNDYIYAQGDNDTVYGGDGDDFIQGGGGDDTLQGDGGADYIEGNIGNDTIYGNAGIDRLFGDDGDDDLRGGSGEDRLYGGTGNDTLYGQSDGDFIYGQDDNDTIYGGAGDDFIHGGNGVDLLNGDEGDDYILGGAGIDTINGGADNDNIEGGADGDIINGGEGLDRIWGDDGDDTIYGGDGDDRIQGGADNDTIYGEGDNDFLYGGGGDDTIDGGEGNDSFWGGSGDDEMSGGGGDDLFYAGEDNDTVYGGDGEDIINGQNGNDELHGGADVDRLYGDAGDDLLFGDGGRDRLYGGDGNDVLQGGADDDFMYGHADIDILYGGSGNDTLNGGGGGDIIIGGAGEDFLYGSSGADTFLFSENADRKDFIFDFDASDRLDISDLLGAYDSLSDDINDFVRASASSQGTMIEVDRDGTGTDYDFEALVDVRGQGDIGSVDALISAGTLLTETTTLDDLVSAGTITL